MSKASHAANYAVDLIGRHERRTTGMIWAGFTGVGNSLGGADAEAQKDALRALLAADPRLRYHAEDDSWSDKTEETPEEAAAADAVQQPTAPAETGGDLRSHIPGRG